MGKKQTVMVILGLAVSFMAVSCGREGAQNSAEKGQYAIQETGEEDRSDIVLFDSKDQNDTTGGDQENQNKSTEGNPESQNETFENSSEKQDDTVAEVKKLSEEKAEEQSKEPAEEQTKEQSKEPVEEKAEEQSKEPVEEQEPQLTEMKEVRYVKSPVYVRRKPDPEADIVCDLKAGRKVDVTGFTTNKWYRIVYDGKEAYLYGGYLCETEEELELIKAETNPEVEGKDSSVQPDGDSQVGNEPSGSLEKNDNGSAELSENGESSSGNERSEGDNQSTIGENAEVVSDTTVEEMSEDQIAGQLNRVMEIINTKRAENGVSELINTPELMNAAAVRANELVQNFSHQRPDGQSCFTSLGENQVVFTLAGENIAAGQQNAEDVMNSWMGSSGHKANILNTDFQHVGIGLVVTEEGYGYYWVQLFTD